MSAVKRVGFLDDSENVWDDTACALRVLAERRFDQMECCSSYLPVLPSSGSLSAPSFFVLSLNGVNCQRTS